MFVVSMLSSVRPAVLSRSLWQATQYLSSVALCDCAGAGVAGRGGGAFCARASTHVQQRARTATAARARVSLSFRISKRDSLVVIETNDSAVYRLGYRLIQGMSIDDSFPSATVTTC